MKTINIKRRGILHRIAKFGGYKSHVQGDDFCAWARRLVLGTVVLLFLFSFVCAFAGVLGVNMLTTYYGDDFKPSVWQFLFMAIPMGLLSLGIGIPLLGALCLGVGHAVTQLPEWINRGMRWLTHRPTADAQSEPSAIGSLYAALRGRICAKLRITE